MESFCLILLGNLTWSFIHSIHSFIHLFEHLLSIHYYVPGPV